MQTPEEYEVSQRIGRLILGLKRIRGMTREDVCKRLGIGSRTLDNYLNGVSSFKLGTLLKFADLCKVKLADILDDTEALKRLYPENIKDKGNIFLLFTGYFVGVMVLEFTLFAFLILLLFYARNDKNSQSIVAIFIFAFSLEIVVAYWLNYVVFPAIESYYIENIYAFATQLLLSLLLALMIKYRMFLGAWFTKGNSASIFEKNQVDAPLYALACTLALIDFAALMENFIRNLECLGINEEVAKPFWELTFIYDYFAYIKAVPYLLCMFVLYAGITARRKQVLNKANAAPTQ
ncbi:helix-turn-helix domain-containing protein [Pseudoalteromonas piscicida]|uniref:XRE family transcriptional regulator n=1 Tax=Pseudoalteromonas piscicida TaxID=43662 RepID=A0AAD0RN37_PSEO7|nr:helix-turn-helix transcriptional regulator [Pseudoalteromonas piscicida]ASD69660.1 transcriptional regulator [Pseudoalteromonas piscicida]AXR00277.1 XRE family transcriptional regulator [Pseudoalteromonas piscicida]AXR04844.1 XRE family transcriptional regulator [Pseudoalteromonas piscicida]